jgi:hypothetical protein
VTRSRDFRPTYGGTHTHRHGRSRVCVYTCVRVCVHVQVIREREFWFQSKGQGPRRGRRLPKFQVLITSYEMCIANDRRDLTGIRWAVRQCVRACMCVCMCACMCVVLR